MSGHMTARLLADNGSTLEGVSWTILGVLVLAGFVLICVVLPIWRQVHEANRERRRNEGGRP